MKKKIAILTTHRANNFGAMLQAYSLVTACRELGANAEILDWRHPFFEWQYHTAWRMHRNPIPAIKHLWWYITKESEVRRRFEEFRSLLPLSPVINNRSELEKIENIYDIFIVGSDQVWNPINTSIDSINFDRACLLDFVTRKKKYAYAASIGRQAISPPELLSEFVNAWKSFDGITMRESAGSNYVEEQISRKIETVVDPVLLHDKDFWRDMAKIKQSDSEIILVYNIRRFQQLRNVAEELAKKEGLKIVDLLVPAITEKRSSTTVCAGPLDFLSYVNSAKYIVTDSFHASAFATIFGKKLYVQYNQQKGNANSRMDTLFSWAGVEGKEIVNTDNEHVVFFNCSLKDQIKLNNEITRSKKILAAMLEGNYSSSIK